MPCRWSKASGDLRDGRRAPPISASPAPASSFTSRALSASGGHLESPSWIVREGETAQPSAWSVLVAPRLSGRHAHRLRDDDGKEAIIYTYELSGATAMKRVTFGGKNQFPVWFGHQACCVSVRS